MAVAAILYYTLAIVTIAAPRTPLTVEAAQYTRLTARPLRQNWRLFSPNLNKSLVDTIVTYRVEDGTLRGPFSIHRLMVDASTRGWHRVLPSRLHRTLESAEIAMSQVQFAERELRDFREGIASPESALRDEAERNPQIQALTREVTRTRSGTEFLLANIAREMSGRIVGEHVVAMRISMYQTLVPVDYPASSLEPLTLELSSEVIRDVTTDLIREAYRTKLYQSEWITL